MKRKRPQPQPTLTLEHVSTPDAQARLSKALSIILRAAARAEEKATPPPGSNIEAEEDT